MPKELSIQELEEIGKKAIEQRKKILKNPKANLEQKSPLKELTKMYMGDCLKKGSEFVPVWSKADEVEMMARKGHIPVMDDRKEHLRHNEMVAWRKPREIAEAELRQAVAQSEQSIKSAPMKTVNEMSPEERAGLDLQELEVVKPNDKHYEQTRQGIIK